MVRTIFGSNFVKQSKSIPQSNESFNYRIEDIDDDVRYCLFEKLHNKLFSVQLDAATDIKTDAHFIAKV